MVKEGPPEVVGWKVGRNQTLAVLHEGRWGRGVAVRKLEDQFSVYRLDLGDMVTVRKENVRSLPPQHLASPPGCLQCCLVGLGPVEGDQWQGDVIQAVSCLLSDPSYPLGVEVLGRVAGGRWAVRLAGLEDNLDVGELLLEAAPPLALPTLRCPPNGLTS